MLKFLTMTSINVPEIIRLQSNQITGRISRKEIKSKYKNPVTANQRRKIRRG